MSPNKPVRVLTILVIFAVFTALFTSSSDPVEEPEPLPLPIAEVVVTTPEEAVVTETTAIPVITEPAQEEISSEPDYLLPHPHLMGFQDAAEVLLREYAWGSGDTVSELQEFLGVTVDGNYGGQTHQAHLGVLEQAGWSTENVPVAPVATTPNPKCGQWWDTARAAGWPEDRLPKLGRIMFAESGCTHDVISRTNDFGLTQINWAAHGDRLRAAGITRDMLLDPYINLVQAKWIADYAAKNYGCWSQPWYMSGSWC